MELTQEHVLSITRVTTQPGQAWREDSLISWMVSTFPFFSRRNSHYGACGKENPNIPYQRLGLASLRGFRERR